MMHEKGVGDGIGRHRKADIEKGCSAQDRPSQSHFSDADHTIKGMIPLFILLPIPQFIIADPTIKVRSHYL